jgi:hypothetical protein
MKFSIVLFVSIVCVSCKTTQIPQASEPKTNLGPDYEVNMVNGVKPIQLKTGPIVCPIEAKLHYIGNSQNSVYCDSKAILFTPKKGTTIAEGDLNKVLICEGKIILTGKNTGICNERVIPPIDFK